MKIGTLAGNGFLYLLNFLTAIHYMHI